MAVPGPPSAPALYLGPTGVLPAPSNASFAYGISRESEDVARQFRLALPDNTRGERRRSRLVG